MRGFAAEYRNRCATNRRLLSWNGVIKIIWGWPSRSTFGHTRDPLQPNVWPPLMGSSTWTPAYSPVYASIQAQSPEPPDIELRWNLSTTSLQEVLDKKNLGTETFVWLIWNLQCLKNADKMLSSKSWTANIVMWYCNQKKIRQRKWTKPLHLR